MNLGGKANSLIELSTMFAVPKFLVIPARDIEKFLSSQSFRESAIKEGQLNAPFAVRSSASSEDSAKASFAGMFHTVLNVSLGNLASAFEEVVVSAGSERVGDYADQMGVDLTAIQMNVIIQEMIDAQAAGVCLTRVPELPSNVSVVEAIFGLGENLVSGRSEPDIYYFDRVTGEVEVHRRGNQILMTSQDGESLVPADIRRARKLSTEKITQVVESSRKIEEHFGWRAADVEWAFDHSGLWILQARPVVSV